MFNFDKLKKKKKRKCIYKLNIIFTKNILGKSISGVYLKILWKTKIVILCDVKYYFDVTSSLLLVSSDLLNASHYNVIPSLQRKFLKLFPHLSRTNENTNT